MKLRINVVLVIALACLLVPAIAYSQEMTETGARSSVGFRAGYGFTGGDWTKSRVVPVIQQFGSSMFFEGDVSFLLEPRWAIVLGGGYMQLDGSKWEQYAYGKGDALGVSASITQLSATLRPYLFSSPIETISLDFGLVGMFASGSETVDGQYYSYDFFSSFRVGGEAALEYDRLLSPGFAFTLRAGAVVVPNGMNYADGESRTIMYMPVSAGVRILF